MTDLHPARKSASAESGEAGFMLLAVVVMAALVLIALAVAAPVVARDLRRDKEEESEHRAQQYVRAIQLYQRQCKCALFPPSMDALEKSNNIRFLRHQWIDPLTGKADWRILHNPQTKVKGFFGEELTGITTGLGTAAGLASGTNGSAASTSTVNATGLSAGFNGATIGSSGTPATPGGTTPAAPSTFASSAASSGGDSTGIIKGVGTSRAGDSILTPGGQTTYDTWEFQWDARLELLSKAVNVLGGGVSGTGTSGTTGSNPASGFGTDINGKPNTPPGGGTTDPSRLPGSSFPAPPRP